MDHQNEYHDSMVAMLELVWGEGFMAPGGEGNVAKMVEGLELEGRRVLDLGCGLGGPACILAGKYGAHVVGIDLEAPLIERARRRSESLGLGDRAHFEVVTQGPLAFDDESFDLVMSSGGVTQTADKLGIFFYGFAPDNLPFGNGTRCVATPINRIFPAVTTDAFGRAEMVLDFTSPPASVAPSQIFPAVDTYFQYWFRDPAAGGATFDATSSIHVRFCP